MRYINLYHAEFRPPRVVLPFALMARATLLFLLALIVLYLYQVWDADRQKSVNDRLEARVVQLEKRLETDARRGAPLAADPLLAEQVQALERRIQALARVEEVVASGALGTPFGYSSQFRSLAQAIVPGAWLTGIVLEGKGNTLSLTGRALASEDAARYVNRLRQAPQFAGFSFAAMELRAPEPVQAAKDAQAGKEAGAPPADHALEFHLMSQLPKAQPGATPQAGGGQ